MSHPFPVTTTGSQPIPAFLGRPRLSIEEIRKDPFKLTRQRSRLKQGKKEERIDSARCVSLDVSKCKIIQQCFKEICNELGWKLWTVPRQLGRCDIYWQAHQIENFHDFSKGGAVSKFPNMADILKKINLTRALDNLHMLFPEEYDFHPRTWFLPDQFHEFCADVAAEKRKAMKSKKPPVFIVKPDAGTQGEGIYLIRDPQDYIMPRGSVSHVVQEYIAHPYLLDKTKFDLRLYVVLLSLDPISIYISREGLARFCTVPYKEPSSKNLHDCYMHLTNYSLNKYSETYIHTDRLTDGSKRTITSVLIQLAKQGKDTSEVWTDIEQVVVKTMIAIVPELKIAYNLTMKKENNARCFQVLGFDIILTENLKPILLEVNANPSLAMTFDREVAPGIYEEIPSHVDKYVKQKMIKEVLLLVAPRQKLAYFPTVLEEPVAIEPMTGYESLFAEESHPDYFLYELYPGAYSAMFSKLRILERLATIYQHSLGLRETLMSANSFRMFARKCCLVHQSSSLTVAALDILFIEIQRKAMDSTAEIPQGLNFQSFLEAFIQVAKRSKLKSPNTLEMVDNLLHYCEANLEISMKARERRAKLPKIPVKFFTKATQQSVKKTIDLTLSTTNIPANTRLE